MYHTQFLSFASRLKWALLGVAVLSLVASCQQSSDGSFSSSGGGSSNTQVVLGAFNDFQCTSGWTTRDGALGLRAGAHNGTCNANFPGGAGKYQVSLTIQTEFDGSPVYRVMLNGATIKAGTYPTSTPSLVCGCADWRQNCPDKNVVIDVGVFDLKPGDVISFYGQEVYPCGAGGNGAYAKWHNIILTPVN